MKMTNPILVLGVGNLLLTDDGIGIHAIAALEKTYSFPSHVQLLDGGVQGLNLLGAIAGSRHLIVIDAIRSGGSPGTLYRLSGDQIPKRVFQKNSLHQVGLLEALTLAGALGPPPSTVILGLEPLDVTTLGLEPTPPIRDRIPELVAAVLKELEDLGCVPVAKGDPTPCAWPSQQE